MAGGMGAAIVRRKEFDVLMKLSAIELVLDSVVGEMNLVVEVRQIVFARPVTDLILVAKFGRRCRGDRGWAPAGTAGTRASGLVRG
jgi:hypothetical protein